MSRATNSSFKPNRRWFNQRLAASAAFAFVPAPVMALQGSASSAFEINSAPGVHVQVSSGEQFSLTVINSNGDQLEKHESVTATSIHALRSSHFSVSRIQPPHTA